MKLRLPLALLMTLAMASVSPGADAGTENRTFLWRVTSDTATVYLLGSIHAMRGDSYPLPGAMEAAYDEASVVVFEVNLDDLTSAAFKMLEAGMLPAGRTLESELDPSTWNDFSAHVLERGIDPADFQTMKPWMAALNLTMLELAASGYLANKGLDAYFSNRAARDGKERVPLETVDLQVSLFADLTERQSLAFLRYTLVDLQTMIPQLDELSRQWRAGDVAPVERLLLEGFREFPDVFERMVTDRNQAWMTPIEMLLAGDRDALVVVGALHLVGEGGLVEMLRDRGYTVEQM